MNINTVYSYAGGAGAGTGIVITSDGKVLTNNHVIDGATQITATDVGNGRTYQATVVGYDPSHDIAVLQLQNASGLATATLGKLREGEGRRCGRRPRQRRRRAADAAERPAARSPR